MSDDLIKRAREAAEPWDYGEPDTLITELVDRIEAQAAEIERLRGLLKAAPAPSDYVRPENYNMAYINWDQRVRHALAGKAEQ